MAHRYFLVAVLSLSLRLHRRGRIAALRFVGLRRRVVHRTEYGERVLSFLP